MQTTSTSATAARALRPGGWLLAEIGAGQGRAAAGLLGRVFPGGGAVVLRDLAGLDRVAAARRREAVL